MKLPAAILAVLASIAVTIDATVYFKEQFGDEDGWKSRWVESKHKSDYGQWKLSAGKFYGDAEADKGIQTSQDARFYALSARFEPFSNEGKPLVIQFTIKHEQKIDCGGGYVKIFPSDLDQSAMHGDSQYYIMFGPDICGYSTKKVHVIFNYKGQNHLIKKDIKCKDDELTHLYTLILNPDQTYEVRIDDEKVESGSLEEDWDMLPAKTIKDPEAKKPSDWDDRAKIPDPSDTKPEDWDQVETIPDPDAKKPDDWDEDMDGEWEPPMITNPEYKGEWKPKQIDNPDYKGPWVHPEIDNPEYTHDAAMYKFDKIGVLGLDLWQVKSGTIFDNLLISDDVKEAEEFGKQTWGVTKGPEKKMKEEQDDMERKLREEEEKSKKDAKGDEVGMQPGMNPGGYPGGGYGYPNWNPNNKILSPGYGGGGYGGHGMGGSPFSRSVQNMGYQPKSSGFAKKAMVAAGVGAVAGMALGYGLGRFPRPHFNFRSPQEEQNYNNYMYRRYGTQSTDEKDYGRDYVYKPPPRAETYENFMGRCMNRTDLLKSDGSSSTTTTKSQGGGDEDDDTVSIEEIGYPALIEQMKSRRCMERYMVYSERFLEKQKAEQQMQPSRSSPLCYGVIQLFTSVFMLLSSMLLLQ